MRQKVRCPACGTTHSSEPNFCSVCGNSFVGWASAAPEARSGPQLPVEDEPLTRAEIDRIAGLTRGDQPGTSWLIAAVLLALLLAWLFPVVIP